MVLPQGAARAAAAQTNGSLDFRHLLAELIRLDHVRGGLVVTPEGVVIAAALPREIAIEPLSALATTLGRDLELRGPRPRRGAFLMAHVAADDGTVFVGGTPVGFIVVVGDGEVNRDRVRLALRTAMETVRDRLGLPSERSR